MFSPKRHPRAASGVHSPGGVRSPRFCWALLILTGLCGGLSGCAPPLRQVSQDEAHEVAERFLTAVREDRAALAWESTTAEFKSAQGRDRFLKFVAETPFLAQSLPLVAVETVAVNDQSRLECVFRGPPEGPTVRVLIGQEGDVWRVDRLTVE